MGFLKWVSGGLAMIALAIGAVFVGARWHDGPLAIVPGGPFQSGEWVEATDVDFGFAATIAEVELESDGRSRTTWVVVEGARAFVPVSLEFPPGKSWHLAALDDPRAVVRIDGKRYRRALSRVTDADLHARLASLARAKYGDGPAGGDAAAIWFFELAAPAA